jgi:hypothetical protein
LGSGWEANGKEKDVRPLRKLTTIALPVQSPFSLFALLSKLSLGIEKKRVKLCIALVDGHFRLSITTAMAIAMMITTVAIIMYMPSESADVVPLTDKPVSADELK